MALTVRASSKQPLASRALMRMSYEPAPKATPFSSASFKSFKASAQEEQKHTIY